MPLKIPQQLKHAEINRCCESGCVLKLHNVKNYFVLKGEKISDVDQMCDCIIFHDDGRLNIALVELKSGSPRTSELINKLANSGNLMSQFFRTSSHGSSYRIFPILLAKHYRPPEFHLLRKATVKIQGKKYPIRLKKCGEGFLDVISHAGVNS